MLPFYPLSDVQFPLLLLPLKRHIKGKQTAKDTRQQPQRRMFCSSTSFVLPLPPLFARRRLNTNTNTHGRRCVAKSPVKRGCDASKTSSFTSSTVNVVSSFAISLALLGGVVSTPSSFAFDSKTSQSLSDTAKDYKVELTSTSEKKVSGSVKITSKLNRSLQETVTFDFSSVDGLAPNTKHGVNIHDENGKSWNPEVRPHGAPDSVKKFGASACHFVGDGCVLNRHYGDLGNISVDNEGSIANVKDIYVSLNEKKKNFIGGKEFVIREKRDDFTTERDDGDAGKIIAKGEIVAVN